MFYRCQKQLYKWNSNKIKRKFFQNNLQKYFCNVTNLNVPPPVKEESSLKDEKIKTSLKFKFNYGVVKLPHFSKRDKGGEDAYAVHDGMLCVADGVGGWNESGIDPSKYSNELCENVKKEFIRHGHRYYGQLKNIFAEACSKTLSIGSCTFVMCSLDLEKDYLHTLNLGDSGYMLIRGIKENALNPNPVVQNLIKNEEVECFKILYRSEEQQHSFNFPYQVGTHGDSPYDATTNVHEIKENDIIVLATDGLWDNMFENQILQIIKPYYEHSDTLTNLNSIAKRIAENCEKISNNTRYKSPFSQRSGGLYIGGKPDDITVIVAQIVKCV